MEMEFFVPRRRLSVGSSTGSQSASAGTSSSACARTICACARTIGMSCRTTRPRRATSSTCFRSAGQSSRDRQPGADFDLTQHAQFSGEKLEYFDQATGERYVPHVIEPAAGADRATLAFSRRRLRRGSRLRRRRGRRRATNAAAPAPAPGPGQGRGAAAREEGRPA